MYIASGFLSATEQLKHIYRPEFYRLGQSNDKAAFAELLNANKHAFIYDEIAGQLKELIKSSNPTLKIKTEDFPALMEKHLSGVDIDEYGVWVYYPWSGRIVHILDEAEFIFLRTAANRHKITTEEHAVLATKKVGVIGLSVGQSVSVTMAMERSFGEIRLADFDTLELNNLNRIRTGVQNLGLLKGVCVAREIAEIDPFIKTVLFTEGLTEENINDFFIKDGKLDAVIDECDSVDVKILCRIKAKQLHVPVLMEASDRGTLDVERFDLYPDRPIMHGWLEHLEIDFGVLKKLRTAEEKLPYMLPIAGLETLSPRMKASMVEIEQTITTWPQLATAVTLGGAVTADTCRRIFLDQFTDSGRYFIDMEELVPEKKEKEAPHVPEFIAGIQDAEMKALMYEAGITPETGQIDLDTAVVTDLVNAALLAPSGGNAQPWKWNYQDKTLFLFLNIEYETKLVDFDNTASFIGFGTSTENLILKAHQAGLEVAIVKFPLGTESKLIAAYRFFGTGAEVSNLEPHIADVLVNAIPNRMANRKIVARQPIANDQLEKLIAAARTVEGADLKFINDEKGLHDIGEIIAKADRIRIMHKGGHLDFLAEMLWTEEDAQRIKRGLEISTIDLTPSERTGFNITRDWRVIDYLNKWNAGSGLERFSRKSVASASAIGLITMPKFEMKYFFEGGRAVERVWLTATHNKISFQPLSISTFLFNRLVYEGLGSFPKNMGEELVELRREFERIFAIEDKVGEILLFRVFIAEAPEKRSIRVPVEEVLSFN